MSEKYIERLQRERAELIAYIQSVHEWYGAMDRLQNSAYKGDARRAVDDKRAAMDAAKKIIEPILAEGGKNG